MNFKNIIIKNEYRSPDDNVINDFYIPLLKNAVLYKRAVGFFSSSSLIEITKGISGLVKNNGRIQIVASPELSKDDIEAIDKGYDLREEIFKTSVKKGWTIYEMHLDKTNLEDVFRQLTKSQEG